jgi:hypothetical protein
MQYYFSNVKILTLNSSSEIVIIKAWQKHLTLSYSELEKNNEQF